MNWTRIETPHGLEIPEIEYARMLDALPEPERTMRLAQDTPCERKPPEDSCARGRLSFQCRPGTQEPANTGCR